MPLFVSMLCFAAGGAAGSRALAEILGTKCMALSGAASKASDRPEGLIAFGSNSCCGAGPGFGVVIERDISFFLNKV